VIFKEEYDLFLAEDGPTAIKLAQENDIDVVVTDLRMAEMSGLEVLERVKYIEPDIEVIIMTGFETTDTVLKALRLRASDYINMPFDLATMRAAVSKAMQRHMLACEKSAARKKSSSNLEKVADLPLFKRRGRLLIVDGEDGPRQSLRVIFKEEYDLFMAEDGVTAIELAMQHDIDVVVLDTLAGKGMSGIKVLERLKILKPDIEVIMMTAFETTDIIREALRGGACDYINKPFDLATVRAAVSKAMQHITCTQAKRQERSENLAKF
jgi:DNA-binding NtrC family response regulator